MRPEARAFLHDIERAAVLIDQFRQGRSFDDYLSDALLRLGVERQLEIIGEAVNKLSRIDPATAAALTGRRRIIALRNILIHGYATVDDRVIWNIIERDVPSLQGRGSGPPRRLVTSESRHSHARRLVSSIRGASTRARWAPV